MSEFNIEVKESVKEQINKHKVMFMEMAYKRLYTIENAINVENTPASIRLLYIKELYCIWAELENIKFKKTDVRELTVDEAEMFNNIRTTVIFVRNVLSHFPLFNTWDEIWISKDFTLGMQEGNVKGQIYKFLSPSAPRPPRAFHLQFKEQSEKSFFQIFYPDNLKDDERVFLKDIITEKTGATSILALLDFLY